MIYTAGTTLFPQLDLSAIPIKVFMQVLIQLALRRYFGKTVSSYENVSQGTFLDGRVEFIPGHWPAVVGFCSAAEDEDAKTSTLRTLLIKAIQQHSTHLARTVQGQDFYRNLSSLKWAVDAGEEIPNFLKSLLFEQAGSNLVLTNSLSSRSMEVGVWLRHPDSLWIHSEIEERHGDKCVLSHLLIMCLIPYVLKKLMICFQGAHLRVGTHRSDRLI